MARLVSPLLTALVVFLIGSCIFDNVGFRSAHCLSVEDALEEMYCGSDDCYGLLGVAQNATKTDIRKAYRRLSIQLHPDRNPAPDAAQQFSRLAKAQEVLLNDDSRGAYDYYLAHPASLLALYYGIRAIYPSQTHPGFVVFLMLVLGSFGQYINNRWKHRWRIEVVEQTPQFKRSMDVELESRLGAKLKKMDKKAVEAAREEVKAYLLDTAQLNGEVVGSTPPRFKLTNAMAVQFLLLPYTILKWIAGIFRWTWRYRVLKQPYTKEDQEIMTRWLLDLGLNNWNAMDEKEREELLGKQLWIEENFDEYNMEKNEAKLNSARYRQWKRMKRKGAL